MPCMGPPISFLHISRKSKLQKAARTVSRIKAPSDTKVQSLPPEPVASSSGAGRPRSEEVHQAILDATLALIVEVGFSALTVEGVASRAGVGKATIYRRWSSKLPLVIEAFGKLPGFEPVDTGSLEQDLKQMLHRYVNVFNSTPLGIVLPSLAGERTHNPELASLFELVTRERRQPLTDALQRAVERGEIARDLDLDRAADLIVGPIAVALFFRGGRINPKLIDPTVELALNGLRPRK